MSVHPEFKFQPTPHAVRRWQERFPGRDMLSEFWSAKKCGRKTKRRIKDRCKFRRGTYYVVSPCGAVFVCHEARRGFVITVFPKPGAA